MQTKVNHRIGNFYLLNNIHKVLLAHLGKNFVVAIYVENGEKWHYPLQVKNVNDITNDELSQILHGFTWDIVRNG